MDGHDAFITKSGYVASGKGMAQVGRTALRQAKKGKLARLGKKEALGRRARLADDAAKARGGPGISLDSRPTVGRRKQAAWDLGFNSVGKSFNPITGSYKKATQLSGLERKVIGAKAKGKTVKLKTKSGAEKIVKPAGNRAKNAPSSKGRQIYPGVKTQRGKLTKVMASRGQSAPSGLGHTEGYSLPDGRGGGHVVVHTDANFKTVHAHEMAHIKPKRNPVRLSERRQSPLVQGREEGRADFIAHGKQTTGQYPGGQMFQGGYNEVQGKMAAAKFRKKKFG